MSRPNNNRTRAPKAPWQEPTYGPNRYAWMTVGRVELIIYDGSEAADYGRVDDEEEKPETEGPLVSYAEGLNIRPIRLSLTRMGRRPLNLSLTYYTAEELTVMRSLINEAFDLAMDRSAALDEAAAKASADGLDGIPRLYRPAPRIMRRPNVLTR